MSTNLQQNVSTPERHQWSVLILSRHERLAASTRLRTQQFIPALEGAGACVRTSPFFDESYLRTLYSRGGRRRMSDVARAYLRRLGALPRARKHSVLWIEKEVFPYLPGWAEAVVPLLGIPYVVDYDDATFHLYDRHKSALVRNTLSSKFDPILRGAHTVTVGNAYLQEYVSAHGAKNIVRLPTVLDVRRYSVLPPPEDNEIRIGWIGSPGNTAFLSQVFPALRMVHAHRPVRLVTIGAGPLPDIGVPVEQHDWSEADEARLISSFHVGIMPLFDRPFERGKCGYKLIQYMASARPVVASPVGVNAEMVTPDIGLLASSEAEWTSAFERLVAEKSLRESMGLAGRRRAERDYSLSAIAPTVVGTLASAAGAAIQE